MFAFGIFSSLALLGCAQTPLSGQAIVRLTPVAYRALGLSSAYQGKPVIGRIPSLGAILVKSDPGALSNRYPGVRSIEPNATVQPCLTPNDPRLNEQWYLAKVNAMTAWDLGRGSTNIKIAIVDSGINYNHEDLSSVYDPSGYDFVNDDSDPMDDFGHGTIVAGIASAATNNGIGVAGMGFGCKLIAVKVINAGGSGTVFDMAQGITYAVDNTTASVINVSAGTTATSQVLFDATQHAFNNGVVLVAAAGNNNSTNAFYPAAYQNVLPVGASTQTDARWAQSNYGNWVQVAAPGEGILSTNLNPTYGAISGTSVASPIVAGLAGLVYSALGPGRSVAKVQWVQSMIRAGCADVSPWTLYGRIDARDTLRFARSVSPLSFAWAPASPDMSGPFKTARDSAGNIYVAHEQGTGPTKNVRVAKYDSAGILKWQKTVDGFSREDSLANLIVDASGNCTAAVSATAASGKLDFLVVRFNTGGAITWRKTWDGPDHEDDRPLSLTQNPSTTLVVGSTQRTNGRRYAFIWAMRNTDGATVATKTYNLTTRYKDDALDASPRTDGKFYVVTSSSNAPGDFTDAAVLLFSPTTNTVTKLAVYANPGGGDDSALGVRTTRNQDAVIMGNDDQNAFVARVSSGGGFAWSARYPGNMRSFTIDTSDNLYWTGTEQLAPTNTAFVTLKIDGVNGSVTWKRRIGGMTGSPDSCYDLGRNLFWNGSTLVATGEVALAGTALTLWYNSANGQLLRAARYNSGGGNDKGQSVCVSSTSKNVFVGCFSQQAAGVQARLLKYAP